MMASEFNKKKTLSTAPRVEIFSNVCYVCRTAIDQPRSRSYDHMMCSSKATRSCAILRPSTPPTASGTLLTFSNAPRLMSTWVSSQSHHSHLPRLLPVYEAATLTSNRGYVSDHLIDSQTSITRTRALAVHRPLRTCGCCRC